MSELMHIQGNDGFGKYLGLEADFGASKKQIFESVCRNISARLHGWAEQFLSTSGKEVLIKAVAMALPNHDMSCFKLLVSLCRELESEIACFWWKTGQDRKPIHWVDGSTYLCSRRMAGWVLEIWYVSILLCWQRLVGGFWANLNPFWGMYCMINITQVWVFWRPGLVGKCHGDGEGLCRANVSYWLVCAGGWGMGSVFGLWRIHGYRSLILLGRVHDTLIYPVSWLI